MKHTKGPWRLDEILEGDYDQDSELPDNRTVTHCVVDQKENLITYGLPATSCCDEFYANACLIAACPTMYEFINTQAKAGSKEAKELIESINKIVD